MSKQFVLVAALAAAYVGFAETFPNLDGSGDISKVAAWGESIPAEVEFDADGTFNAASGDVSFGTFFNKAGSRLFDLSATPGRTISITGERPGKEATANAWKLTESNTSVELKGGVWDLGGVASFGIDDFGSPSGVTNCQVVLSGGCQVKGIKTLQVSYGTAARSKIVIQDGSSVTGVVSRLAYCGSRHDCDSWLELRSGGKISASTYVWMDGGGSSSLNRTAIGMLVTDEGSYVDFRSGFYMGDGYHTGNRVHVTDGGWADLGSAYLGYSAHSGDNVITVDRGGVMTNNYVHIGYGAESSAPNRLEYVNGGIGLAKNFVYVGSNGSDNNELLVSNATLSAAKVLVGNGGGSGNRALITGRDTVFITRSTSNYDMFGPGSHDNELVFTDGATWDMSLPPNGYYSTIGSNSGSTNNTLRITRGASITFPIWLCWGYSLEYGNAIEVTDGGALGAESVSLRCEHQRMTVSNATVTCQTTLALGTAGSGGCPNGGCRLELCGTNPVVTVGTTFSTGNNSPVVHFGLPASGYVSTPLTAETITLNNDTTLLTADLTDFIEAMEASTARVKLATATSKITVSKACLANSNALLPEKCEFYVDGNDLMLKVHKKMGLMLILR